MPHTKHQPLSFRLKHLCQNIYIYIYRYLLCPDLAATLRSAFVFPSRLQVAMSEETIQPNLPHTQPTRLCFEMENEAAKVWSEHAPASPDCSPVTNAPSQEPERLQGRAGALLHPGEQEEEQQQHEQTPQLLHSSPEAPSQRCKPFTEPPRKAVGNGFPPSSL